MQDSMEREDTLPDGFFLKQRNGALTGVPLYWVESERPDLAIVMPLCSSEREAIRVFKTLKAASQSGYFEGLAKRRG